jgi:hypothetical protein
VWFLQDLDERPHVVSHFPPDAGRERRQLLLDGALMHAIDIVDEAAASRRNLDPLLSAVRRILGAADHLASHEPFDERAGRTARQPQVIGDAGHRRRPLAGKQHQRDELGRADLQLMDLSHVGWLGSLKPIKEFEELVAERVPVSGQAPKILTFLLIELFDECTKRNAIPAKDDRFLGKRNFVAFVSPRPS